MLTNSIQHICLSFLEGAALSINLRTSACVCILRLSGGSVKVNLS